MEAFPETTAEPTTVDVLRAIASPVRLRILRFLRPDGSRVLFAEGRSVKEIEHHLGVSQSTVSSHLRILENARLIKGLRIGQWTTYRRLDDEIERFLAQLACSL